MASLRKSIDPSKFTKSISKSITGISTGFNDPDTWVTTGNFALNKRISGSFEYGIPLGKMTIFAGEFGSGKSYMAASIVKYAQEQDIYCFVIDTENALDEDWLQAVGVDTDELKFTKISATMIDDVAKLMSNFIELYKADYMDLPKEERPKVLFVIDSLGMLMTPTEISQFQGGDMKGDMGRKPKQLKAFVTAVVNMIGELNIGMIMTNHTYELQDMFSPDPKISGGGGPIYAASIVVAMKKGKLKTDEDGGKTKDVKGIRVMAQVNKSRYAQPFQKIEYTIPWSTGLDPYSGLIELFEGENLIVKDGNKIKYVAKDGTEYKEFRKNFGNDILDIIMKEYSLDEDIEEEIETLDTEQDDDV